MFLDDVPDYSLAEVKEEFRKNGCPIDMDVLFQQEAPVRYLVEQEKLSDQGLETMVDIIFHSDLDDAKKEALLNDALASLLLVGVSLAGCVGNGSRSALPRGIEAVPLNTRSTVPEAINKGSVIPFEHALPA